MAQFMLSTNQKWSIHLIADKLQCCKDFSLTTEYHYGYFAKLAFLLKTKAAEKFYHRYMSDIPRIKFFGNAGVGRKSNFAR